jgi:hypothetical protein
MMAPTSENDTPSAIAWSWLSSSERSSARSSTSRRTMPAASASASAHNDQATQGAVRSR